MDFNLLSDHRDLMRLARGFRQIAALHELPPLQAVTSDAFPASFTDKIRQVGTYNTKNQILTSVGAVLMDGPAFLRQFIMRGFIMKSAELVARCGMMMLWKPTSARGGRGVALLVFLPHGSRGRSDGGDRPGRKGARCARTARGRCLDIPCGAVCEHQFPDHDGGRKDRGRHAPVGAVSSLDSGR